jgi:hypothetical protein
MRRERALGQSGVGHRFERERADAVEQPVANGDRCISVVDDHQRAARQAADHVDRCRRWYVEPFENELDRR